MIEMKYRWSLMVIEISPNSLKNTIPICLSNLKLLRSPAITVFATTASLLTSLFFLVSYDFVV